MKLAIIKQIFRRDSLKETDLLVLLEVEEVFDNIDESSLPDLDPSVGSLKTQLNEIVESREEAIFA